MEKRNNIIYWIATVWLSLGMVSTAVVQLMHMEADVATITSLGYPAYLLTILGIWKLLGVIAVLVPKFPLVKEWAYAGFFIAMSGAGISHLAAGHPVQEILPSLLLLVLTVVSWYFRPASRRFPLASTSQRKIA